MNLKCVIGTFSHVLAADLTPCAPFARQIMVVPHSHNDPGWGWTVVDYYRMRTRNVLESIVRMMPELPHMRFMWTEVTFLQMWWQE